MDAGAEPGASNLDQPLEMISRARGEAATPEGRHRVSGSGRVVDDLGALIVPGPLFRRAFTGGDLGAASAVAVGRRGVVGAGREPTLEFGERRLDVLPLATRRGGND